MTDAADNDLGIGQGGLGRVITVAILSIAIVVLMVTFLVWNTQETDRAKSLFMYVPLACVGRSERSPWPTKTSSGCASN